MNELFNKHATEVVMPLAKKGEDIIKDLTPEKAHLWHMASALADEIVEFGTIKTGEDETNTKAILELGDIWFFLIGIAKPINHEIKIMDAEAFEFHLQSLADIENGIDLVREAAFTASNIFDPIKKYCVYNKQVNLAEQIGEHIDLLANYLDYLSNNFFNKTTEYILERNKEKLFTRYTSGSYSNEEANERKDMIQETKAD